MADREKRGVAETSKDALRRSITEGTRDTQIGQIFRWLKRHSSYEEGRGHTRNEIAESTGIRLASVCGRVDELIDLDLVDELPKRPDRHTAYLANPIAAVDEPGQPRSKRLI